MTNNNRIKVYYPTIAYMWDVDHTKKMSTLQLLHISDFPLQFRQLAHSMIFQKCDKNLNRNQYKKCHREVYLVDDNNVARLESVTDSDPSPKVLVFRLRLHNPGLKYFVLQVEGGGGAQGARCPLMLQKVKANPEKLTSRQNMDLKN